MKPDEVRTAGVLLLVGGCTSLLLSCILSLTLVWFPAYLYGIPTALYALSTARTLRGNKAEGSGGHGGAGAMLFFNMINLDFIGAACAWFAMVKLSMPEARMYLRKPTNFPAPEQTTMGRLQLDIQYHPALLLLTLASANVRVDGQNLRRGWGHHSIDLQRGRHTIEIDFDYLMFDGLGLQTIEAEVKAGQTTDLFYRFNAPWIFAKGRLESREGNAALPKVPREPPEPPKGGPSQPRDGMQPFSV